MADKNTLNNEEVFDENLETEQEENQESEPTIEIEAKKHFQLPKVVKKAGRIAEAGLAIFGGLVVTLMIYDAKSKKRKPVIDMPAQGQIPQNTGYQSVSSDVKVDLGI